MAGGQGQVCSGDGQSGQCEAGGSLRWWRGTKVGDTGLVQTPLSPVRAAPGCVRRGCVRRGMLGCRQCGGCRGQGSGGCPQWVLGESCRWVHGEGLHPHPQRVPGRVWLGSVRSAPQSGGTTLSSSPAGPRGMRASDPAPGGLRGPDPTVTACPTGTSPGSQPADGPGGLRAGQAPRGLGWGLRSGWGSGSGDRKSVV